MITLKQIFNYCKQTWIKRYKQFKVFIYKKTEEVTAFLTSNLFF
jgi:hypothetical protein